MSRISSSRRPATLLAAIALCLIFDPASADAQSPPAPSTAKELQEKLVTANRILSTEGLVGPFGHVSVRSDKAGKFLIAKHESADRVKFEDIVEVENDLTLKSATDRALYLEVFIHSSMYQEYPEVKAVVHTHAPYAIALGTLRAPNNRILPTTNPGANLGNFIPIFPQIGLVRGPDKAVQIARALQGQNGVLLRGHGTVVVGNSLEQAVLRAVYLEFEARSQMVARSAGDPIFLTPEESDLFKDTRAIDHAWHYYEERARKKD